MSPSVNNPPCPEPEGCCEGESECTFVIGLRISLCYDDDMYPPSGPTNGTGFGIGFLVSGTTTYNDVETTFGPQLLTAVTGFMLTLPAIDRIDDEEEITIQINPVTIARNPPVDETKPDECFATNVYEFEPITLVPQCGQQIIPTIGTKVQEYHNAAVAGCFSYLFWTIFGSELNIDDFISRTPGLRGASITVETDVDTVTSRPFERLYHLDPCTGTNLGNEWYYIGYLPFLGQVPPGTRLIRYTFNPPPGIPGYRSVTYDVSTDYNINTGPLDTCGNFPQFPSFSASSASSSSEVIIDRDNYICHCRGFPIGKQVNYSDGFFSGTLSLRPGSTDGFGAVYEGILSAYCPQAFTYRFRPPPQITCCDPTGGTVQAKITVAVCGVLGGDPTSKPPQTDPWNYFAVSVSKGLPLCSPPNCNPPSFGFFQGLLSTADTSVPNNAFIGGTQWLLYPTDYEPLIASVPLNYPPLPQQDWPCLRGTATITEVV